MCPMCLSGSYCIDRDDAYPCPPGYYCPLNTGNNLQPCPVGTYNPIEGLHNITQCTQCDGGKYCLTQALSEVTDNCTAGYYCTFGVNTATPSGTFTGEGGECTLGHYCPEGSPAPVPFEPGSYR